jgi:hypothetical protein
MFSRKIREYKLANPNAPAKEIAEAIGVRVNYVYQALRLKPKRISKVKPVATSPTQGQEVLRAEILRLNTKVSELNYEMQQMGNLLDEYRDECRKLKLHHGGLEYIISYLESRLGIKEQDGTTV